MRLDITIGDTTFTLQELRAGDLRRVPQLAPALTSMMAYNASVEKNAFPGAVELEHVATIIYASASRGDPTVTREAIDAAIDGATLADTFRLVTTAARVVFGDEKASAQAAEDPSPGEATRPSS